MSTDHKNCGPQEFKRGALPHSFLAEKMFLSCLLTEPELLKTMSIELPINAFYFKNHQELYKIFCYMVKNRLSTNTFKFVLFLQTEGLLHRVGGTKVLLDLIAQEPNLLCFDNYLQVIHDKFLRRTLIQLSYKTINSSYITNIGSEKILQSLEAELLTLTNRVQSLQSTSNAQLFESVFIELKDKFLNPKLPGLTSGFQALDRMTQGFQKSDLIVIAGRPSMGKTALSLAITLNVMKATRLPILFFSLEMSKEQIIYRLLSMESQIASTRLKRGQLYKNDWAKLNKLIKLLSKLPLFVDDSSTISISELRTKIKKILIEQNAVGLVIVDYLQLMQFAPSQPSTRSEELARITRGLKNLAREFNIPIIALSQLSRNIETRLNQTPILSDLRESGSIEQDADLVLMLSNGSAANNQTFIQNEKLIDLIIAKHRNGPTGTIQLRFNGKQTKFFEPTLEQCSEPESNW